MNRANTPHFRLSKVSSAATSDLLFVGRPFTVSDRPVCAEDGKEQKKSTRTETVGCSSALDSFLVLLLFVLFVLVAVRLLVASS